MSKVTEKRKVFDSLWVMQCRECGEILASASTEDQLPDSCMCDCDVRKPDDDDDYY